MITSSQLHEKVKRNWFVLYIDWIFHILRTLFGKERIDHFFGMKLDFDFILQLAQKDVGLTNSAFFPEEEEERKGKSMAQQALEIMLSSLQSEATLTPIGQFLCVQKIRNALRTRLRLVHLFHLHPEINQIPILSPIFIIGFPRSGTTALHRLLSQTNYFHFFTLQLALNPFSHSDLSTTHHNDNDNPSKTEKKKPLPFHVWTLIRIFMLRLLGFRKKYHQHDLVYMYNFMLRFLAKSLQVIHDCQLDQAEEESVLLDMCFTSQLTEAMYRVPTYAKAIELLEPIFMYRFLKKVMQALQFWNPQWRHKQWLLKSPNHIEWLPLLVKVFPDAIFIHPSRPLYDCLASSISACCHARRMSSNDVNVAEVAIHWYAKFCYLYRKLEQTRKELPHFFNESRLLELSYKDFCHHPQWVLYQILTYLEYPIQTTKINSSKEEKQDSFHHHRDSQHKYNISDLGIEPHLLHTLPSTIQLLQKV